MIWKTLCFLPLRIPPQGLEHAFHISLSLRRNGHRTRLATQQWGQIHSSHCCRCSSSTSDKKRAWLQLKENCMSTASKVAEHKERHPGWYCRTARCLWFTGRGKACPKHTRSIAPYIAQAQSIAEAYNRLAWTEHRPDLED